MSRLIVKNLARSVTSDKLKDLFSQKGVVTDVQLKYTSYGKFRHFAFVGFKKEDDAQQALEYFNNTYINGSRVKIEPCSELGSPPQLSKRNSAKSGIRDSCEVTDHCNDEIKLKAKEHSVINDVLKNYEDDPVFFDFVAAQAKSDKIWGDLSTTDNFRGVCGKDAVSTNSNLADDTTVNSVESSNIAKTMISDSEYMKMKMKGNDVREEILPSISQKPGKVKVIKSQVLHHIKIKGLKYNAKKKDVKQLLLPLKPQSIRRPVKMKGIAYVGFATEKEMNLALKKHMSFFSGRRISVLKYEGESKFSKSAETANTKWKEQIEGIKQEETIAESGRIFARNLAYTVTENDIESLFSKFGQLVEVILPIDRVSRKSKGFAIVTFLMPEHALKAFSQLDGSIFHGRMLHLIPGKSQKSIEELLQTEGLTFKQKKYLKEKSQALISTNWNTLFIGQNAVADLLAKNYNTTKENVLNARGSESLAVRLALGETELVNATRQFLLENNIHLDAFNQPTTIRSKTVLLVKNLPAETSSAEIYQLFAKFGELGRVVLPPSGVTAIVEFLEPSEAKHAFKKLAYTKFKHLPLYLEWAPSNTFLTDYSRKTDVKTSNDDNLKEKEQGGDEQQTEGLNSSSDEEDEELPEPNTTLFIKNLNVESDENAVKEHFKKCGLIHNVIVARKKGSANKLISMGYGFIQFKKKESLEKALKCYQHSVLDGRTLELKRSDRTLHTEVVSKRKSTNVGKQSGSKIVVRNIPFQATMKEVRELFKTFGEIKSLRLPKKLAGTGSHRGFGFIEYYTKHDAKRAFKALCQSTHLYGRRLVLEWAINDENIDDLRKKTASYFMNQSSDNRFTKAETEFEPEMCGDE